MRLVVEVLRAVDLKRVGFRGTAAVSRGAEMQGYIKISKHQRIVKIVKSKCNMKQRVYSLLKYKLKQKCSLTIQEPQVSPSFLQLQQNKPLLR
jgi:hypothetical protein